MRSRCLLHKNKLDQFEEFLKKNGWIIEETKGVWEYLRAKHPDRSGYLQVYGRNKMKEHLTVFGEGINIAHRFIQESKKVATQQLKEKENDSKN